MAIRESFSSPFTGGDDARTLAAGAAEGGKGHVSRRTLVVGAAWSVPAVTLMVATPAMAVSANSLSVTAPNGRIAASGATPVTAVAKNASGQPLVGAAVSFSGPTGASFTPVSATTDASGAAVTQMDLGKPWATPGSTAVVTAVSASDSNSGSFTVVGSNVVVSGVGYSSVLGQSERVFPSPVVDALAAGAATGYPWFMVLLADGTVWTKGNNAFGQLGDGSTTDRSTWAPVSGLSGVTQIAAGEQLGIALLSGGSVRAWGRNDVGQTGDGYTASPRTTPVRVWSLRSGVTQIAAFAHGGLALSSDGSVRAWGYNARGQLGDGTTSDRPAPFLVWSLGSGVTQIAAANHTGYALSSGGSVKAWGDNPQGQVGDGSTTTRLMPVQVSGLPSGVTQIAAGVATAFALSSNGSVKAWGYNDAGQTGDGSTTNPRSTPVQVSGLTSGVTQVAASAQSGYALLSDGSVKAWGYNGNGQLGDGSTTGRTVPVSMNLPAGRVVQRLGTNSNTSQTAMIVMKTS